MRLDEGVYQDVSERAYHADCAPEPSLSASGAKVLLKRSAKAFQWQHPRLRPAHLDPREETTTDAQVFGTAVHKLVLGRGKEIVEVDAPDWKTKAAKQERADITVAGKLAMLKHRLVEAKAIAKELAPRVPYIGECATELVLVWRDKATDGTPVWCRSMVDIWNKAERRIEDLKITGGELSDAFVGKQIGAMGYDLSMAFYRRAFSRLLPELEGRIKTRLIFAERKEPFDTFPVDLTEGDLSTCDRMVQAAIDRFAECTTAGAWPGVAPEPRPVKIPDWHLRDFLESELED